MTLIENKNTNEWTLKAFGTELSGDFKTIVALANQMYGVSLDVIEEGIIDMVKNDNNAIEIGDLNKTFIFSTKK